MFSDGGFYIHVSETDIRFGCDIFAWFGWCLVAKQRKKENEMEGTKELEIVSEVVVDVPREKVQEEVPVAVKPVSGVEGVVSVAPPVPVPSVEVRVAKPFYEGLEGVITDVSVQYFANVNATGIVVVIVRDDGEIFSESLWWRAFVGAKSKLGAFASALGSDYAKWKGKRVRIVKWSPGDRRVEEVKPPA
jgi:hypothetical protein